MEPATVTATYQAAEQHTSGHAVKNAPTANVVYALALFDFTSQPARSSREARLRKSRKDRYRGDGRFRRLRLAVSLYKNIITI